MNTARKQMHFLFFVAVATMLLSAINAFAGPGQTTYQAKIIKPDGYPLESSSVNFKFTILNPAGDCILFAETYSSVNMNSTGGLISFSLGSGVKTYPVSSPTFEDVFSNITPSLSCDAGGPVSYSPLATDIRKIVMQFHDGNGWQTLPAMNINAVPYAMYANEAMKLNGKADTDFVQVSVVPTCTASEAIRYNGTSFSCVTVGGSGAVSSGSVITALGYTPADGASLTTITSNISNVSTTVFSVSSTVTSLANSVAVSFAALTSSQWITTGTEIGYAGGFVGIGTTNPSRQLDVYATSGSPAVMALRTNDYVLGASGSTLAFQFGAVSGNTHTIINALSSGGTVGNNLILQSSTGNVGIGLSNPVTRLEVSGGVRIGMEAAGCAAAYAGTLRYSAGSVEYCNGATWLPFGVAGAGINSLNSSISGTQTFATGITGTVFNISSNNGVHTFNIPLAASSSVAAGLLSNADYTAFSNKVSAASAAVVSALGYTPASAAAVSTLTSNLDAVSAAVATVQSNTAASFAAITSSQWNTSGTSINYMAGNVGIQTDNANSSLTVSGTTDFTATQIALPVPGSNGSVQAHNKALDISPSVNYTTGTQFVLGEKTSITVSSATTATDLSKLYLFGQQHITTYAAAAPTTQVIGANYSTMITSAGAVTNIAQAMSAKIRVMDSNAANGDFNGLAASVSFLGSAGSTGSADEVAAVNAAVISQSGNAANTFAIANAYGVRSSVGVLNTASSTITNAYGLYVDDGANFGTNGGTLVNQYGLFIENQTQGTTSKYNIYSAGSSSKNYFAGSVIYGAGSATQAPIKLTSGTLLSSPQSGTIEYDGASFYLTDGSNTRRAIVTDAGAISNLSSSGSITLAPTGSVIVSGGLSVATNLTAPTIYGSSLPSGNLTLDSTSSATKGNILLAPSGGYVGIGTSSPTGSLHVALNNPGTAMSTVTDAFVLQNKNVAANALTAIMFANQDGFGTGQITARQNTGNFGSQMIFGTKSGAGGSWNTKQLVLDTTGNIGIGTASPSARLEVVPPNDTSTALYIGDSTTMNTTGLYFSRWGSASAPMGIQGTLSGVGANPLVLQAQAGNVGVGTTAPTQKLDVMGYIKTSNYGSSAGSAAGLYLYRSQGGSAGSEVAVGDGAGVGFLSFAGYRGDATLGTGALIDAQTPVASGAWTASSTPAYLRFLTTDIGSTVGAVRMVIKENGNVGIGTMTPGSRFQIATPASGGVNNRWVSGNSNADLIDMSGANGDMYLDHIVGARITASTSATINRAATFKIDAAPSLDAAASSTLTVNNLYALWVENGTSIFGGNVGVGVSGTPSSYGHGGTNKFIEIQNSAKTIHSQSHLILTSGVSDITASSIGSLTWAQPNVATARKEVAWIGAITESASGTAPAAYFQVNTRSVSDALPLERMRVTGSGDVGIGSTSPQAYLHVSKNLGGAGNGVTVMKVDGQVSGDTNYKLLDLSHGATSVFTVTAAGKVGVGVSSPSTVFSNISTAAVNQNVGDQNGTGGNTNTFNWGAAAAGYAAAITNNSNSAGANGLNVRTLGTSNNQVILAVGTGVSSTANASDILNVRANGVVGVGTNSAQAKLHVSSNATSLVLEGVDHTYMSFFPNTYAGGRKGWLGFGTAGTTLMQMNNEAANGHINLGTNGTGKVGVNQPNPSYMLDVTGTIRGFGITDSSDLRLKKHIQPLDLSLEKILRIEGVSYYWKDQQISERKQIGFIAQQLEKIFPELVETDKSGMKSVNYSHLIAPLVEAVKSMYTRITDIEASQQAQAREIASVKAENAQIKNENQELKERLDRLEKALNEKK